MGAERMEAVDDELELEVDRVIAACGGDPRAAIRGLILMQAYYDAEIDRLTEAISRGYTRGAGRIAPTAKL